MSVLQASDAVRTHLVQQEQVGLGQQQLAEGHAAALAPGQRVDDSIRRRAAQRVHRTLQHAVDLPGVVWTRARTDR